ncbi:MAG: alpha-L-arabinofuranosidase C-terminal domain-containing protein [Armatimonas sp.]
MTKEEKTGDVLVKLVNIGPKAQDIRLNLAGAGTLAPKGEALILTGTDPLAENTFDAPLKIAPTKQTINGVSSDFVWKAPAWSASILRLKTKR